MKRGSVLVSVLLLMCISILLFFVFSSSTIRDYTLSKNRTSAGKIYYKTESEIHDLMTNMDSRHKIKQILTKNMAVYTGSLQRMKLSSKMIFSKDWAFYLYPVDKYQSFLDVLYHNKVDGIHCELTGSFAFENEAFISETGILDSTCPPSKYEDIQTFMGECTEEWVAFCKDVYPEKVVKDIRSSTAIRLYQKLYKGYELHSYLGMSGEHSLGVEDFQSHDSLNTAGRDSSLTVDETRTDFYLEGVINGFPRKDPTILFGIYVLDGDLYVNTDSKICGILIMKGGKIVVRDGVKFDVHGLLISEQPIEQNAACSVSFDYKYMLREAVALPNFFNLRLIGIRE